MHYNLVHLNPAHTVLSRDSVVNVAAAAAAARHHLPTSSAGYLPSSNAGGEEEPRDFSVIRDSELLLRRRGEELFRRQELLSRIEQSRIVRQEELVAHLNTSARLLHQHHHQQQQQQQLPRIIKPETSEPTDNVRLKSSSQSTLQPDDLQTGTRFTVPLLSTSMPLVSLSLPPGLEIVCSNCRQSITKPNEPSNALPTPKEPIKEETTPDLQELYAEDVKPGNFQLEAMNVTEDRSDQDDHEPQVDQSPSEVDEVEAEETTADYEVEEEGDYSEEEVLPQEN